MVLCNTSYNTIEVAIEEQSPVGITRLAVQLTVHMQQKGCHDSKDTLKALLRADARAKQSGMARHVQVT
jgi:hypothetical protein